MIEFKDKFGFGFSGHLDVEARSEDGSLLWKRSWKNHICDSALDILLGFLARDLDNKMLATISIGEGGDYNPTTNLDTGARVAPRDEETQMRRPLYDSPIAHWELVSSTGQVKLTTVVKVEHGNSDSIDEFGLLSLDGTLFSHYITPVDTGTGRAEKLEKTALMYWVIRWTLEPELRR